MIKENAWAKLNLNLHLLPNKLTNNLYQVRFINCQLNLHDELFFEKQGNNIELIGNDSRLFPKKENLVFKAAYLFKKIYGHKKLGAIIRLKKNIPIKAGLASGSSDAAATIKGLMKLWSTKLTQRQQFELAKNLGKDVFYCLTGGLCEVSGVGTIIEPLKMKMPEIPLIIIAPDGKKPSTKWMYNQLLKNNIGKHTHYLIPLKKGLRLKNKRQIIDNLFNDFELTAIKYFPVIKKIKNDLVKENAINTLLLGSGLSVAGFFASDNQSKKALTHLKVLYKNILWTKTK